VDWTTNNEKLKILGHIAHEEKEELNISLNKISS